MNLNSYFPVKSLLYSYNLVCYVGSQVIIPTVVLLMSGIYVYSGSSPHLAELVIQGISQVFFREEN